MRAYGYTRRSYFRAKSSIMSRFLNKCDRLFWSHALFQNSKSTREILIHHHDVGVDKVVDKGWVEGTAFCVETCFVADFAVGVVEFEVAEDEAVVGAGDEFGSGG